MYASKPTAFSALTWAAAFALDEKLPATTRKVPFGAAGGAGSAPPLVPPLEVPPAAPLVPPSEVLPAPPLFCAKK